MGEESIERKVVEYSMARMQMSNGKLKRRRTLVSNKSSKVNLARIHARCIPRDSFRTLLQGVS
jgi:hypothetical protein